MTVVVTLLVVLVLVAWVVAGVVMRRNRRLAAELPGRTSEVCRAIGARSSFVQLRDVRLHVVVAGPEDGPLVVMLHGFPECWHAWKHQIPLLASLGYRVVAPDQRGYGLSDKPDGMSRYSFDVLVEDVAQLIEACGRQKAVVVGHDWGGAVAWKVAIDRPELVDRLVIMNAPHPVAFARELTHDFAQLRRVWYMVLFQLPLLPEALLSFSPAYTAKFFFHDNAFQHDAFKPDDLAFLAANLAQEGALNRMVDWYRAAVWYPASKKDRPTSVRTLMLWAEDDVALGLGFTRGLESWVPNLRTVLVPQCGHFIQTEQAQVVSDRIAEFLG